MKSRHASAPVPPEQIKPVRHEKIERMNTRRHGIEQKATKKEIPDLWSHFKTVAADACRDVAFGAKTGEEAPIFLMNEPRYLGCYGVLIKTLCLLRFLL